MTCCLLISPKELLELLSINSPIECGVSVGSHRGRHEASWFCFAQSKTTNGDHALRGAQVFASSNKRRLRAKGDPTGTLLDADKLAVVGFLFFRILKRTGKKPDGFDRCRIHRGHT